MSITEVDDFAMYCRVCLQLPSEKEVLDLNLIYDEEEQLTYRDCFTLCTKINIDEDETLPQNLCRSCGLELQMAYDFYRKVEESKRLLMQLQEQQQTESAVEMTEDDLGATNESQESSQEVIIEGEEHLELEELQTEHLEEEDAETIELKFNSKAGGEEYIIETMILSNDDGMDTTTKTLKEQITWEDAVVAVANEQHLPIKKEKNAFDKSEIELEETALCEEDSNKIVYEDEEIIDMEMLEEDDDGDDNEVKEMKEEKYEYEFNEKPQILSINNVQTKRARCRYTGPYNCDLCQKTFPNHSRMMLHRRSHMSNRPKFLCPHCDRVYATKQAMDVHIRTVHIKNGFICPICSKLYVIKKSLEVHLRYHTGDFPYQCELCDKKFAQIGHLNTHRNVKHNSVRFCCEHPDCGKFFTSSTSLRNHEFTHSEMPFQCSYCGKGYPSKSKLKVHILRKHNLVLTLDELEPMRKFKTVRSKLNLVKLVKCED